jgi:hypothetical protein
MNVISLVVVIPFPDPDIMYCTSVVPRVGSSGSRVSKGETLPILNDSDMNALKMEKDIKKSKKSKNPNPAQCRNPSSKTKMNEWMKTGSCSTRPAGLWRLGLVVYTTSGSMAIPIAPSRMGPLPRW